MGGMRHDRWRRRFTGGELLRKITNLLAMLALVVMTVFPQRVQPKIDTRVGFGDRVITHIPDGQGWETGALGSNVALPTYLSPASNARGPSMWVSGGGGSFR